MFFSSLSLSFFFFFFLVFCLQPHHPKQHQKNQKKKNFKTQIDLSRAGIPAPSGSSSNPDRDVIFVLGGPGSGKGTQCSRLVADFPGVVHLSAGDLLRAHTKSGTPDGDAVARMIAEGQIVPSSVTISLLEAAMAAAAKEAEEKKEKEKKEEEKAGSSQKLKHRFLVDGFPRNDENRAAYESLTGSDPALVLFFDCPEAVMRQRLLGRGQGRTDDNDETIKKRFRVFVESSVPVVEYYEQKGKVAKINADRGPDEVYEDVKRVFASRTGAVAK